MRLLYNCAKLHRITWLVYLKQTCSEVFYEFFIPRIIGLYVILRMLEGGPHSTSEIANQVASAVALPMTMRQLLMESFVPVSGSYAGDWLRQVEKYEAGVSTRFSHPSGWEFDLPLPRTAVAHSPLTIKCR